MCFVLSFFFFFSSRRRHTRCGRDWSSDVCSSDLASRRNALLGEGTEASRQADWRRKARGTDRDAARSRAASPGRARTLSATAHRTRETHLSSAHTHGSDWRTPTVVLICGGLILTLGMGIRHGFGLFLQPMTADLHWG